MLHWCYGGSHLKFLSVWRRFSLYYDVGKCLFGNKWCAWAIKQYYAINQFVPLSWICSMFSLKPTQKQKLRRGEREAEMWTGETAKQILERTLTSKQKCLSIYLPIHLNPRGGHQTGSGEPSAVGWFFFVGNKWPRKILKNSFDIVKKASQMLMFWWHCISQNVTQCRTIWNAIYICNKIFD